MEQETKTDGRFRAFMHRFRRLLDPWLIGAVVVIVAWYLWKGCPIRYFTGIACPGCGMTRAAWALLQLDFATAFHWHPLIFLMPPLAVLLFLPQSPLAKPPARSWALGVAGVLFGAVYLYRMFWGDGSVVAVGVPDFLHDVATLLGHFH